VEDTASKTPRPHARLMTAAALLALVALVALAYIRSLAFGQALYACDIGQQDYPWQTYLAQARLHGDWFPIVKEVACGHPLWADGQSGILDPLHLVCLLPFASTWTFGLTVFLHCVAAALGMFLLARLFRISLTGSVVAGATFALSGAVATHEWPYPLMATVVWMPWGALGGIEWAYRRTSGWMIVGVLAAVFSASNHPQELIYTFCFIAAAALAYQALVASGARALERRSIAVVGRSLAPFALGLVCSGICLYPVYVMIHTCGVERGGWRFLIYDSLGPWNLVTAFLPNFFGAPTAGGTWGTAQVWESSLYHGGLAALLVLVVRPTSEAHRRAFRRLAVGIILFLFVAMGGYNPLYRLVPYLPVLNRFRCPARWAIVSSGLFCLAVGLVIDRLRRPDNSQRLWSALARMCLGVGLACGFAAAWVTFGKPINLWLVQKVMHRAEQGAQLYASYAGFIACDAAELAAVCLAAGLAFLVASRHRGWESRAVGAAVVLALAQVVVFTWRFDPTTAPDRIYPAASLGSILASAQGPTGRVMVTGYGDDDTIPPGSPLNSPLDPLPGALFGVNRPDFYGPMAPPVCKLIRHTGHLRLRSPSVSAALGCNILCAGPEAADVPAGWEPLARHDDDRIYTNGLYCGLAWTVSQSTTDEDLWQRVENHEAALDDMLVRPAISPVDSGTQAASAATPARHVDLTATERRSYRFHVDDGPRQYLILAISNLPGWSATVNGTPAQIRTANTAFMAVDLPTGPCDVEFKYAPYGLRIGGAISALGLLCLLVVVFADRRPTRSDEPEPPR